MTTEEQIAELERRLVTLDKAVKVLQEQVTALERRQVADMGSEPYIMP